MLFDRPYSHTMDSSRSNGYFDDVQIRWRDSPKPLPAEVVKELIKNNVCAKLIRDMGKDQTSPQKLDDSPVVFRSRTLMPRKKIDDEKLKEIQESPRSRARKRLRSISKIHERILENAKKEQKDCFGKPASPIDFQAQVNEELDITVSQNTFLSGLLKANRVTSTPKILFNDIGVKFTETPSTFDDSRKFSKGDKTLRPISQNENLASSFEEKMTIFSQESLKNDPVDKKNQELKKSPIKNKCTLPGKLSCTQKQTIVHTKQDNNILTSNKFTNCDKRNFYKPEIIRISSVSVVNKPTNNQNKNISPQPTSSAVKNVDEIDDDFYSDDSFVFVENSEENVHRSNETQGKSNVTTTNIVLVGDEKSHGNQSNDQLKMKGIKEESSNKNVCDTRRTSLTKDIVEDPKKDELIDSFEDDFFDNLDENDFPGIKAEECIENTRKRKSGSGSPISQPTDVKKPHLEISNDPIQDDFYDDLDF